MSGIDADTLQRLQDHAVVHKALSDPTRLAICVMLAAAEEMRVGEIVARLGQSQVAISRNLGILRDGRYLRSRRSGKYQYYRLISQEVRGLVRGITLD